MSDDQDAESPPTAGAQEDAARWREPLGDAPQFAGRPEPVRRATYPTLDYEVDGRVARLTFNRPDRGNTITADTPRDLAHAVERADLDPAVHLILLSGRGRASAAATTSGSTPRTPSLTVGSGRTAPRGPSSTRWSKPRTTTLRARGTRCWTTR